MQNPKFVNEVDVRQIVRQEVAQIRAISLEEVKDEGSLVEYGFDSLKSMELIVALEARFSITIDDADIDGMQTVNDVVRAVEGKVRR